LLFITVHIIQSLNTDAMECTIAGIWCVSSIEMGKRWGGGHFVHKKFCMFIWLFMVYLTMVS